MTCSFCGNGVDEVKVLVAGPNVNICDECIDLCVDLVNAALAPPKPASCEGAQTSELQSEQKVEM